MTDSLLDAAEQVGDAQFRKLEELLRKGGWSTAADKVQHFRKVLTRTIEDKERMR